MLRRNKKGGLKLSFKTIIVVCVALLFMPWISIARAEDYRAQEIDVDIRHSLSGLEGVESVNAMEKEITVERDLWPSMLKDTDGLYWGNMIPASSASVGSEGITGLRMVCELSPEIISSGCSRFWIRIPFVGTNIERLSLGINEDVPTNDIWRSATTDMLEAVLGSASYLYNNDGGTDKIIWGERGVFIDLYYPLSTTYQNGGPLTNYPFTNNYTFVIDVVVQPQNNTQPIILLSEESYLPEYYTIITKGGRSFERTLGNATPALSFIFKEGLTSNNLFSFTMEPTESTLTMDDGSHSVFSDPPYYDTNYIYIERYFNNTEANETYLTLSIPYIGTTIWDVTMKFIGNAANHYFNDSGWVGPPNRYYWTTTTDSIENQLTVTCPFQLINASSSDMFLIVIARPRSEIELLSSFDSMLPLSFYDNKTTYQRNVDVTGITRFDYFSETWYRNASIRAFPVWCNLYLTEGVYAEVDWVGEVGLANFVWGRGAIYPGDMEIWIELDNQTAGYWRGNVEVIYGGLVGNYVFSTIGEDSGFWAELRQSIINMGQDIWNGIKGALYSTWSFIRDGLFKVWDFVSGVLEWIGNFVIDLVGKIIAFLKNVVEFVGVILNSSIWILPPSLILFGLAHASNFQEARGTSERIKEKRVAKIVSKQRAKEEAYREKAKKARSIGEERYKRLKKREAEDYDKYLKQKQKEGKIKI